MSYKDFILRMIDMTPVDNPVEVKRTFNGLANEALKYYNIARCVAKEEAGEAGMMLNGYPKTFPGTLAYNIGEYVFHNNDDIIDTYLICLSTDDNPPTLEIMEIDLDGDYEWDNDWYEGEKKITLWYYITVSDLNKFLLSLFYRR